MSHVIVSSM